MQWTVTPGPPSRVRRKQRRCCFGLVVPILHHQDDAANELGMPSLVNPGHVSKLVPSIVQNGSQDRTRFGVLTQPTERP